MHASSFWQTAEKEPGVSEVLEEMEMHNGPWLTHLYTRGDLHGLAWCLVYPVGFT